MATSLKEWITSGIDDDGIDNTLDFGQKLATMDKALTSSQIRNSFGEVRRIQQKVLLRDPKLPLDDGSRTALALLRPKLAYATARSRTNVNDSTGAAALEDKLTAALAYVRPQEQDGTRRFFNFCDYFEAILAYHKKFGGKD